MDVERVTKRTPVLKPVDAHLRLWIKHLRELLKIEQVQVSLDIVLAVMRADAL